MRARILFYFVVTLSASAVVLPAFAQSVDTAWVRRYSGNHRGEVPDWSGFSDVAVPPTFQFTFNRALPSPLDGNVFALGFGDDGYLWVHSQNSKIIYKLNPLDGGILQSFPSNVGWFHDLDVKDGILYAGEEPEIYRYATSTGDQLPTLYGPVVGGARGLTFVGDDLYVSGVLEGYPGVRLGRVDPSDGTLLGSSAPPDLVWSHGIGAIGEYICYLVEPEFEEEDDVVLNIVDPSSGNLIESHILFVAYKDLWSLDASDTELFISRRDLYPEEIWVYEFNEFESPRILSIADVGNDQGKQVRVKWNRCVWDGVESTYTITEYSLWRRVDQYKACGSLGEISPILSPYDRLAYPPGEWDFVKTVPARGESTYSTTCPTLADSTVAGGMYWSVFFVSAMTPNPLIYFDSDPDSGYSVDNLAPAVPEGLRAIVGADSTMLMWEPNVEEDLAYYAIYRGSCPDFVPDTSFDYSIDTSYVDQAVGYCYKVSAFDFAGNESPFTGPVSVRDDGAQPELPQAFSLSQNYPNPFNPQSTIRYALPEGAQVSLVVYNVAGQEIETLVNERQEAGYHECVWNGNDVASGIYFYRLQAGDFVETRKMMLMK